MALTCKEAYPPTYPPKSTPTTSIPTPQIPPLYPPIIHLCYEETGLTCDTKTVPDNPLLLLWYRLYVYKVTDGSNQVTPLWYEKTCRDSGMTSFPLNDWGQRWNITHLDQQIQLWVFLAETHESKTRSVHSQVQFRSEEEETPSGGTLIYMVV